MKRDKTINLAMIGTGMMLELIAKDLELTENIHLKVLFSRDKERGVQAASKYGFEESSDNLQEVLEREDIDLVYIASPHSEHFRLGKLALDAGKPILVEKAMTTNSSDTEALCRYAQERNLFAMEAMWMAFNPVVIESVRRIQNGELGNDLRLNANFSMVFPFVPESRLWNPNMAAGTTLDQGVYTYSLAHLYFGKPSKINARGRIVNGIDAEVAADLQFDSSHSAHCFNGLLVAGTNDAVIYGTEGFLRLDANFTGSAGFDLVLRTKGRITHTERFQLEPEGRGYVPMLRSVANAIMECQIEHPRRNHKATIEVAEIMDNVLDQVMGQR